MAPRSASLPVAVIAQVVPRPVACSSRDLASQPACVGLGVRRRHPPQPGLGALVAAGLDDPRHVGVRERAQPHAVTLQHRRGEPAVARLTGVAGEQGAEPRVDELAPGDVRVPQHAVEGEPQPVREVARAPVADVRAPDHRLGADHGEPPLDHQPHPRLDHPGAAGRRVGAEGDLEPAVALVAQRDVAGVAVRRVDRPLHGEEELRAVGPGLGGEPEAEVHRLGVGVGHRHLGPGDRQRVDALLVAAVDVALVEAADRHGAVGQQGSGPRRSHVTTLSCRVGRRRGVFARAATCGGGGCGGCGGLVTAVTGLLDHHT